MAGSLSMHGGDMVDHYEVRQDSCQKRPWNDEEVKRVTLEKIREYRNRLVAAIGVFDFGIASTANGASKQNEIAFYGLLFTILIFAYLIVSYRPHFKLAEEAKKVAATSGTVTSAEYDEIVTAQEFYRACMKLHGRDYLALAIVVAGIIYLCSLR